MVGECSLDENGRYIYIGEWRKISGWDGEVFESWDFEKKMIPVLGDVNWRDHGRAEIGAM